MRLLVTLPKLRAISIEIVLSEMVNHTTALRVLIHAVFNAFLIGRVHFFVDISIWVINGSLELDHSVAVETVS